MLNIKNGIPRILAQMIFQDFNGTAVEYNLKCIFMMNKTDDPDFVASWQKVEEALKRLDENLVERSFS